MTTQYRELVKDVDRLAARISTRYRPHLVCRGGCSGCCHHHLSVFEVEAAAVREAGRSLPKGTRDILVRAAREALAGTARGEPGACPLLVHDRCSIYDSRPIICRTQGLPLLIRADDGTQEVDFCPLNFSAPGATDELEEGSLVPLEEINVRLVSANLDYCLGIGLDRCVIGTRMLMADIIMEELQPR